MRLYTCQTCRTVGSHEHQVDDKRICDNPCGGVNRMKFRIVSYTYKWSVSYTLYFGPKLLADMPTFPEIKTAFQLYLNAARDGSLQRAMRKAGYEV